MIDNFKAVTFNLYQINKIWDNTSLLYNSDKDYRVKDELKNVSIKTYKNLIFKKFDNRLEIGGSIHYFWNDGQHNANDFNIIDCVSTFKSIINNFDINPNLIKIIGLEYGFNIQLRKDVNQVLSWLRFFSKKRIIESLEYSNFCVAGTNYKSIKIYNKTQDCPKYSKKNLLRFEVKTRESEFAKKIGINTLNNLLDISIYKRLTESILIEWSNVLIFDFDILELNEKHITEYWLEAINNMSRNTFANRKKDYFKYLPKNSIFYRIQKQLQNKADKFIDCAYSTSVKKESIVHNRTITKSHIAQLDKNPKHCRVTGLILKDKDADAKYIRTSTLRYLKENDENTFAEVCNLLLNKSNPYHTKYERGIIKHLAKQVRNSYYNPRPIKNIGYNAKMYTNQYELRL